MSSTEDQWTPPSPWCPNPQWWHSNPDDPDGAEAEITALVMALVYATQPEVVIETGTATGDTALAIGHALAANGHGHLWTAEISEDAAKTAREAVDGLPVTVECVNSLDWDPPWPIDLAWIDSGAAEVRVGEIRRWAVQRKFRPGGLIGVHDTAPNMGRQVLTAALAALLNDLRWQSVPLRSPRGMTLIAVP
jgi:predicted O-methyltransferase YrrM